ncbi:MAG TPA: GDCCVxC domain-containing (seleno)protein [Longimicrobiales bacterium]
MPSSGVISCPACGAASVADIPTDACLFYYECPSCKTMLRPKQGDCCVFCSFGDRRCPARGERKNSK